MFASISILFPSASLLSLHSLLPMPRHIKISLHSLQITAIEMPTILGTSKVSIKFQVTIPKEARQFLNMKAGERLVFKKENGKVILEKA
ncbi:hypothetical protein GTO27_02715 [Candidatus Bathyarchaeota archaeon]|nr:hypothetical protein [Candidatus Bathyarchaeota archaeon]